MPNSAIPGIDCLKIEMKIISPGGDEICRSKSDSGPVDSNFSGSWIIPEEISGGDYQLKCFVTALEGCISPGIREFNIRAFRPTRLNSKLEFEEKGYGCGEKVNVCLESKRAEGGYPAEACVTAIAKVDGIEIYRGGYVLDSKGICHIEFNLPKEIDMGRGNLSCAIEDGGIVENASKTIPILLQALDCTIYPEGGDLIENVYSRFYFEAFTPTGDPADFDASICETSSDSSDDNVVVDNVKTIHEGRGVGGFIPRKNRKYFLKVTRPKGIIKQINLPMAISGGISLFVPKKIFCAEESVVVYVNSDKKQNCSVRLFQLDNCISSVNDIEIIPDDNDKDIGFEGKEIILDHHKKEGVLRVTVFNNDGIPVSERLIFRKPESYYNIEMLDMNERDNICENESENENENECQKIERIQGTPGGRINISLLVTNLEGKPVKNAIVLANVLDNSVLSMVEKRERTPRLPAQVFLENEVKQLNDAHIYLSNKKKYSDDSSTALDLLLGTQGWRKFIYKKKYPFKNGLTDRELQLLVPFDQDKLNTFKNKCMRRRNMIPCLSAIQEDFSVEMPPMVNAMPMVADSLQIPDAMELSPQLEENIAMGPPELLPELGLALEPPIQRKQVQVPPAPPKLMKKEVFVEEKKLVARPEFELKELEIECFMEDEEDEWWSDSDDSFASLSSSSDHISWVRIFSHDVRLERKDNDRVDFAETLYFVGSLVTNEKGVCSINFDLSDSITTFKIMVDAFCGCGVFGSRNFSVESKAPFYIEPKMPLEITKGDEVLLPVALVNSTSHVLDVSLNIESGGEVLIPEKFDWDAKLAAYERGRVIIPVQVKSCNCTPSFKINAAACSGSTDANEKSNFLDNVERKCKVESNGFPQSLSRSGLITNEKAIKESFNLPDRISQGSLKATLKIVCGSDSFLDESVNSLICRPCGCFEQTSSTNYPLIMAVKFLNMNPHKDQSKKSEALKYLEEGYKKLVGYECSDGGYDWFGDSPAHEALTAFGILQFTDMMEVMPVDSKMMERTKKWLFSRKDNVNCQFNLNKRFLHVWDTSQMISDAYICYALTSTGEVGEIEDQIEAVINREQDQSDSYISSLVALTLFNLKRTEEAIVVCKKVARCQVRDTGCVKKARTTIVQSGGLSCDVETTSFALLGWLKAPEDFMPEIFLGIEFLNNSNCMGYYGSTQATVLALKAILEYSNLSSRCNVSGAFSFVMDGSPVGDPVKFDEKSTVIIPEKSLVDFFSTKGSNHSLDIKMNGGEEEVKFSYSFLVEYNSDLPDNSSECALGLDICLAETTVTEGDLTELHINLENVRDHAIPMTLVVVGIPGGLELRYQKLKELVKMKSIDYYEVRGRNLVLYFRQFLSKQKVSLVVDLIAAVPGNYIGSASSTYLYYTDEYKKWCEGLKISILPR